MELVGGGTSTIGLLKYFLTIGGKTFLNNQLLFLTNHQLIHAVILSMSYEIFHLPVY